MTIQFVVNEEGRKTAALVPIEIWERLTSGSKPCRSWQDVQDGFRNRLDLLHRYG